MHTHAHLLTHSLTHSHTPFKIYLDVCIYIYIYTTFVEREDMQNKRRVSVQEIKWLPLL